jgi:amino acid transporter
MPAESAHQNEVAMNADAEAARAPHQSQLGMWDVVSLMIGIVIGVSIFRVPKDIFSLCGSPALGLAMWGIGAFFALCGALCYAELAAAYPALGAEYAFLSRAYGVRCGFLFAWMQIWIVIPASVGTMAFVLAEYAAEIVPALASYSGSVAAAAILLLTLLQMGGFHAGRRIQNLLSLVKILSLASLLLCGLLLSSPETPAAAAVKEIPQTSVDPAGPDWKQLGLALVFVLYAYGGWNDAASVVPEVKDCRKNMPRALLLGLLIVAALYLALNYSYLKALGYEGVCRSSAPAAEVMRRTAGPTFSHIMSLMVMASALGAIHGMLFSGCRLLAAVGQDFPDFKFWNRWSSQSVPVWSLMTISGTGLILTAAVGTEQGRELVDRIAAALSFPDPAWKKFGGGFEVLLAASAPIFWFFFLLTGTALIVLRVRDPLRPRPFRVPFYPLTPILFIASAAWMLWSSTLYSRQITLLMAPVVLVGFGFAFRQDSRLPAES